MASVIPALCSASISLLATTQNRVKDYIIKLDFSKSKLELNWNKDFKCNLTLQVMEFNSRNQQFNLFIFPPL